MIERLARYVAIRSISREEGALAETVAADLAQRGLRVRRRDNNIWCEVGDAQRPRLLLNSHLDTVPPANGWTADPFSLRRDGDRLTGLGANDAKGCVTSMIAALLNTKARLDAGERLGGTVVLALTAEEEISGQGLGTLLEELRPLDAAIVGEPTGIVPMTAQRGLLILRGVATGRSGHPANTPPGSADNAIQTAARDLQELEDFDWGPEHPLLGRCHAHVTQINGGTARNVIPDACEFYLDIRTTPAESHRELFERLDHRLESALHVHSDRLVPVATGQDERIVQAVLRALPDTQPAGSAAMSDMVFLDGIPSVKIGPGESRRSHTPDEYITRQELEAGARAFERIIEEYFRGPI
ncbi:MAG: M20/M25/M40 family metallo-hydrolase [Myxococcales bacterium]|nr:M20/M25/M40 family metallo-hydrolase [Myxococcales bacterium]